VSGIIRKKIGQNAWETVADDGGGGGGGFSETVSGSTDPDTFDYEHIFDIGAGSPLLTITPTALDGDGETWGTGGGEIGLAPTISAAADLSNFKAVSLLIDYSTLDVNDYISALADVFIRGYAPMRYLKVGFQIETEDDFTKYAGPNHPVASFDITVAA
jgi:hypothetical protein